MGGSCRLRADLDGPAYPIGSNHAARAPRLAGRAFRGDPGGQRVAALADHRRRRRRPRQRDRRDRRKSGAAAPVRRRSAHRAPGFDADRGGRDGGPRTIRPAGFGCGPGYFATAGGVDGVVLPHQRAPAGVSRLRAVHRGGGHHCRGPVLGVVIGGLVVVGRVNPPGRRKSPRTPGGVGGFCVCPPYSESTVVGSIDLCPPPWATSILRGLARSASGMVTVSTPFSYVAEMADASVPSPSDSCRR